MKKVGFIGLGIMGKPMSKNLLRAGYHLVVYDIVAAAVEEVSGAGAEKGGSPKDVAAKTDVIITMLPNSPEVKEVVLGKDGVIEAARPGSILIDMSSIAPLASREVSARLAEKNIRMLDAPVSGGEPKAVDGTLSIMVGGSKGDFEEFLPLLKSMGASVVLCGEIGAGNVTKLANQIVVAANIGAVSKALVLAARAGVNPVNIDCVPQGGNWLLQEKSRNDRRKYHRRLPECQESPARTSTPQEMRRTPGPPAQRGRFVDQQCSGNCRQGRRGASHHRVHET